MKIGFIGTGVMGQSIVRHLLAADHQLMIYTRTKSKAEALIAQGASWKSNAKEVTDASEIIFTMVGYPSDVEETYFDPEKGIFASELSNKIVVDLTTSTPSLAEKIEKVAREKQGFSLDAPVSGGDLGAKNGTLTIMAGGSQVAYDRVLPLFKIFGKSFHLHGSAGKGQHTKMANQIMVAGTMLGMTEMLVYSQAAGLDLNNVIETLSGGAAANWSMINYSPRILRQDYTPGFFVKHFIKDLKIVLDEADKMEIELPMTALANQLYEMLAVKGFSDDGTQALIKLWWTE